MRLQSISLLLVSLGLLLASVSAGWAELAPLLTGDRPEAQRYEMLAAGSLPAGLSVGARRLALLRCADTLTSTRHLVQPTTVARAVVQVCADLAHEVVQDNPAGSLGWLTLAIISADQDDMSGFVDNLRRSQQSAPAEQWLAALRVDLAERNRDAAGDPALTFIDDDIALMAQTQTGVATIADRYVSQVAFRERVTRIVESLPTRVQAEFLSWVEAATRDGTP